MPYPFHAMLAICSDLDETPDRLVYLDIAKFLNTTRNTTMGPGVGLEVGNTIYFDMPSDQFAYWSTDDAGRAMVRALIHSGHIDCLHSYGDYATTRCHAGKALDELSRYNCRLNVWIDHAVAPTNFGADIMRGQGDLPGSAAYHADLTCNYGIRYVWRGRVTSVIGQDRPRSLAGILHPRHPLASARTWSKEWTKGLLAHRGNAKYAMHESNDVARYSALRDGRPVVEFVRCNPHWGGVSRGDTGTGLGQVLTDRFLRRLVGRRGFCILYTHLGKIGAAREPFPAATRAALRRLADYQQRGQILVTTTRRLLGYRQSVKTSAYFVAQDQRGTCIHLTTGGGMDPTSIDDCNGMTFYVPDANRTTVLLNGVEVRCLHRNPPDHTGQQSVSLPWPRLEFPDFE